jgi:hypothetical protein
MTQAQEAAAKVKVVMPLILIPKPESSLMKAKISRDAVTHGVHK